MRDGNGKKRMAMFMQHQGCQHHDNRDIARGRAIGLNDSVAGATTIFSAFVTGPLIVWAGIPAAGLTAVLLAVIPFVLRATSGPMKE